MRQDLQALFRPGARAYCYKRLGDTERARSIAEIMTSLWDGKTLHALILDALYEDARMFEDGCYQRELPDV